MFERLKLLGLVALGFAAGYVVGVLHLGGQLEREHALTTAGLQEEIDTQAEDLRAARDEIARLQAALVPATVPDPDSDISVEVPGDAAPADPPATAVESGPADAPPPDGDG